MNRREASKEETRRLILQAARKILARKGGEDCTIKEISEEAGTSPASVVVHFKNKISLFEEALYGDIDTTFNNLKATLPEGASLLERLMHFQNGFLKFYDANRNLYRVLIKSTMLEPVKETPHMSRQAEEHLQFLKEILEAEKAGGLIKEDVDTSFAAASVFSLYFWALITFFRIPEMPLAMITQMLETMTNLLLVGIIKEYA